MLRAQSLRFRWAFVLVGVLIPGLLASACGGGDAGPEPRSAVRTEGVVTLADFTITADPTTVEAGDVTFVVENAGPSAHQFVIMRTDLAAAALPLTDDGTKVDESGAGILAVPGEIAEFPAGTTQSATFTLEAGQYVLICNIPGHYQLGMSRAFTVR